MRKIKYAAILIAMLACGCSSNDEPTVAIPSKPLAEELTIAESQAVERLVGFEADFFAKTAESYDGNIVVSPVGAALYLSMLANCTDGETAAKIAGALGCADVEACNSLATKYMNWLSKADPEVKVSFANGLWYRKGKTLNPLFLSATANYQLDMFCEDFSDDEYLQGAIGSWADKKTGGLIKDVSDISFKDEPAVLANVIAFLGNWTEPFKKENTTPESFYGKFGAGNVEMMHQQNIMGIRKTENCQSVLISFGKGHFDMICTLPDEGTELSDLYEYFRDIEIKRFLPHTVKLALPKFKIMPTDIIKLEYAFSKMGLEGINFSAIYTDNGYDEVDLNKEIKVNQLTAFEVSEKGIEAATLTINGMVIAPPVPSGTVEMTFNRPFLFAVRERSTGLILYAGRIEQL